nr:uncharacterized protein LOC106032211 [Anser cygnoides]
MGGDRQGTPPPGAKGSPGVSQWGRGALRCSGRGCSHPSRPHGILPACLGTNAWRWLRGAVMARWVHRAPRGQEEPAARRVSPRAPYCRRFSRCSSQRALPPPVLFLAAAGRAQPWSCFPVGKLLLGVVLGTGVFLFAPALLFCQRGQGTGPRAVTAPLGQRPWGWRGKKHGLGGGGGSQRRLPGGRPTPSGPPHFWGKPRPRGGAANAASPAPRGLRSGERGAVRRGEFYRFYPEPHVLPQIRCSLPAPSDPKPMDRGNPPRAQAGTGLTRHSPAHGCQKPPAVTPGVTGGLHFGVFPVRFPTKPLFFFPPQGVSSPGTCSLLQPSAGGVCQPPRLGSLFFLYLFFA